MKENVEDYIVSNVCIPFHKIGNIKWNFFVDIKYDMQYNKTTQNWLQKWHKHNKQKFFVLIGTFQIQFKMLSLFKYVY